MRPDGDNLDFYQRENGVRQPDPTLGKSTSGKPIPGRTTARFTGSLSGELTIEDRRSALVPSPNNSLPVPAVRPPRRQRVVLSDPRQCATGLRARVELAEQTSWGEVLIKDLVKAQLRISAAFALLAVTLLGAVPLAFYLSPSFAMAEVIGIPLPWLLLGVAPFPLLFGLGWWYHKVAEQHERLFVAMIET